MTKFLFEKLTKISGAFKESRVLLTANELDVFTYINKGYNGAENLAIKIGADKNALTRLLDALCAMKFLVKKQNKYFNTVLTSKFLVKDKEDYLGDTLLHHSGMWKTWSALTDTVKFGQSFKKNEILKEKKSRKTHTAFIMAMHNNAKYKAEELSKKINLKTTKNLMDLGGGPGTYAVYFARKNKNLNCTVYDLPETMPLAKKIITKYVLQKRVKTYSGDFLKDVLPKGFDAVFLSSIAHIYNKEENIKIFKKVYSSLNTPGKIIIKDYIMDKTRTKSVYAALFSINMLVATKTGSVYTFDEIKNWLKVSGFKNITMQNILDFTVITGQKNN